MTMSISERDLRLNYQSAASRRTDIELVENVFIPRSWNGDLFLKRHVTGPRGGLTEPECREIVSRALQARLCVRAYGGQLSEVRHG